jgi:hypothetical protein
MDTTASLLLKKQLSELNKHPVEGKVWASRALIPRIPEKCAYLNDEYFLRLNFALANNVLIVICRFLGRSC